jgi:hypothetical protein
MALKMMSPNTTKSRVKKRPMPKAMMAACNTKALAFSKSLAPMARLTAEVMPPPIEPADSICCIMTKGNTKAMPASGMMPK